MMNMFKNLRKQNEDVVLKHMVDLAPDREGQADQFIFAKQKQLINEMRPDMRNDLSTDESKAGKIVP